MHTYNVAGHVCPTTGRLAMTVAEAYARPDMPGRHFTLYNAEAAEMGLECWRLIDGMDMTTGIPVVYTLDFASGRSINVQGSTIVYMQRTKAERMPLWVIDLEGTDSPVRMSMRVPGDTAKEAEAAALTVLSDPGSWRVTGSERVQDLISNREHSA